MKAVYPALLIYESYPLPHTYELDGVPYNTLSVQIL
jgi:hypothetical protein